MRAKPSIAFASVLIGTVAALSAPADAACKKFGFTVNDYGKDGPTNDAKNLLDKHISEWAAQNKVTDFQTGKKTVSCELFLDVILFDEHTCTASATVCWGADAKKLGAQSAAAATTDESGGAAPPAPVRKAHALGHTTTQAAAAPAATAPADAAAPPAETAATDSTGMEAAPAGAAPTTPVEQIAAPAETPPAAPAVQSAPSVQATMPAAPMPPASVPATTGATVETGALQAGQGLTAVAPKRAAPSVSDKDRAASAAAAATAAAAAERAAQAAEMAANAAKEAAAAAVAASAASRRSATVPPLDHASGAKPAHTE